MTSAQCPIDLPVHDLAARAKAALEHVCSGADPASAPRLYSPRFIDYVNDLRFAGLSGARQSVELYTKVISNLAVTVEEQVVDGDRVTSRFVVTGSVRGRAVRFNGITISRFDDGLIVEDWSVTDTLGMLKQLGLWRSVLVGAAQWTTVSQALASRT